MRGSTAAARLVAIALVALMALGGTAFAGGGDRLTREQYVKRAEKECGKLLAASGELAKAQAPGAAGKRVARYLHRAADGLGKLVDGFDDLEPPAKLEADHDQLVDVLDSYAEGLDTLAERVKRGQTFRVLLEKNPDTVTRLNGIAERATGLVTSLGLAGCLLPS
jgi:hypothetical protein